MFRSTLARAAAAIALSFTGTFTIGTLAASPTPPPAASPTVAYLDAAATTARGLAAATHTTPRRVTTTLPSWLHHRWSPDACGRGHAGVMLYASGADQSVVVCKSGEIDPS